MSNTLWAARRSPLTAARAGLLRTRALVADVTASPPTMSSPPTHPSPSSVDLRAALAHGPLRSLMRGAQPGPGTGARQQVKIPGPRLARTVALGTSRWVAFLMGLCSGPFSGS